MSEAICFGHFFLLSNSTTDLNRLTNLLVFYFQNSFIHRILQQLVNKLVY